MRDAYIQVCILMADLVLSKLPRHTYIYMPAVSKGRHKIGVLVDYVGEIVLVVVLFR